MPVIYDNKPLCIDLYCGLGGWTEGFLAEGYDVIGFDIERHVYGEECYPAQLVLQDVRTLHGKQFKGATIIVASSPCQEFSYRAMPWKRAKALGPPELGMELFAQAARIQREACEASGRYIPMIQENVRGAQPWVGKAQWHYGSFYLWGDVPALMPVATQRRMKSGVSCSPPLWRDRVAATPEDAHAFHIKLPDARIDGVKVPGLANGRFPAGGLAQGHIDGTKGGGDWFGSGADCSLQRRASSKSSARKAASARIAKIPFPLSSWIARCYLPKREAA